MNENIWEPDVDDFDKVNVETYKVIYEQAKERHAEVIEESSVITGRAMTLINVYVVALTGLIGFIYAKKPYLGTELSLGLLIVLCLGAAAYVFYFLIKLITAKNVYYKGSLPSELFYQKSFLELSYEKLEDLKKVYWDKFIQYETAIRSMDGLNKKRIGKYRQVLRVSYLIIAIVNLYLIWLILYRS